MCNNDVPQTACYCLKKIFLLSQEFLTCCWWCLIQRKHNKPTWINHLSKQHPEKLLWETVSTRWLCGKHLKRARIQHKNTRLKQWGRGQSYCTSWGSHGGSPNRSSSRWMAPGRTGSPTKPRRGASEEHMRLNVSLTLSANPHSARMFHSLTVWHKNGRTCARWHAIHKLYPMSLDETGCLKWLFNPTSYLISIHFNVHRLKNLCDSFQSKRTSAIITTLGGEHILLMTQIVP